MIASERPVKAQTSESEYVYIVVTNKFMSQKLNVYVDFGDEDDQIEKGKEYTKILTGKKSVVAVLNYMIKDGYELVNTVEYSSISNGTGGTVGLGFIMCKKE
ncbi:MAG: hypothetical protein JXR68_07250 [Bacteroidales bacterium]|nr:hypothetical protein [Bacteroidales bacterium]